MRKPAGLQSETVEQMLNLEDVIRELKRRQQGRSVREFAIELGISAAYLSDIYTGKKEPGPTVLAALGIARRSIYVRNTRQERKTRRAGKNAVA